MKTLWNIYKENVGKGSLFEKVIDIDFYDGPTEAACQLADSAQWYICSLVYIDFAISVRIYSVLEIDQDVVLKLKSNLEKQFSDRQEYYDRLKAQVRAVYNSYVGKVFLFKSDWLNSVDYEVTEIPLRDLRYFSDIGQVLEQSEGSKLKWIIFFLLNDSIGLTPDAEAEQKF